MSKALITLADGFEDVEAIAVVDVLRRGGVEVVTASMNDRKEVSSAHGVSLCADALFSDVADAEYDAVILPGGADGTRRLGESERLAARLRRQKDEGRLLCAICAAPLVLNAAGVLDEGVHVTCYPTCFVDLDRPCANVPVVVDGNVITGQAPGSALLFGLVVLQNLEGEAVAQKVARGMVTDVL